MKSECVLEKKNGYLCFTISGEYDRAEFGSYARMFAEICEKEKIYKVLVNALGLKGTDLPTMERYLIGERIAELPLKIKLAVAWPGQHINNFAETVAINRGGFMRVVADLETAEKWLLTPV
jgi:hypothetical protein